MTDQQTIQHFAAAVETLRRATTFRAWIENREASSAELAAAQTFEEALAAVVHWASHKQNVCILRDDAGRGEKLLQIYTVKQESKAVWRRDPMTGLSAPSRRNYPVLIVQMAVDAFEPTRPFDAFRDNAVGLDLTLVEGRS